jgi:hypothetical protein
MSQNEKPESFDIDLLKQEQKDLQTLLVEEMLEVIITDSKTTKHKLLDIIKVSFDVGIEQAIEDYYDAEYR